MGGHTTAAEPVTRPRRRQVGRIALCAIGCKHHLLTANGSVTRSTALSVVVFAAVLGACAETHVSSQTSTHPQLADDEHALGIPSDDRNRSELASIASLLEQGNATLYPRR